MTNGACRFDTSDHFDFDILPSPTFDMPWFPGRSLLPRLVQITAVCMVLSSAHATFAQPPAPERVHPDDRNVARLLLKHGMTYNLTGDRLYQLFGNDKDIPAGLFAQLSPCTSLQSISLGQRPSHYAALADLPVLPQLELFGVTHRLTADTNMDWVRRVPNLECVNLEAPELNDEQRAQDRSRPGDADAAAAQLQHLQKLVLLRLNRQQVTVHGLAPLSDLPLLRWLELNDTPVDDAALDVVGRMGNLETLYLERTPITDRGIVRLGRLKKITSLNLNGTRVTDRALETLREFDGLRGIQNLYLANTQVTDKGLAALADLKSLRVLDVSHTQVTGQGLKHLAGLKELYNLCVSGIHAEPETIHWLEDEFKRPNVVVGYRPPRVPRALRLPQKAVSAEIPSGGQDGLTARRAPEKTPLIVACREWKKQQTSESARRVVELVGQLRAAIGKELPYMPYAEAIDLGPVASRPPAKPGRHTLLNTVRYVSGRPPGPGESYINTCLVYIDGDLLAASLQSETVADPPQLFNGYISNSVVIVNGRLGIDSYIGDSIVIAAGPIAVNDGYISNSLVISLKSLESLNDPRRGDVPVEPEPHPQTAGTTVFVRDGYINQSVVIGAVDCEDLRECIILGRVTARQPYLRGAEILSAQPVRQLPWQVGAEGADALIDE